MVKRTRGKLQEASPGDCVAVFVSEFDRGRGDPANIVGVILEIKDNKYRVGTKAGIIKNWLQRNCFECTRYKGLKRDDIPQKEYTIREIVRILSVGDGQGFKKCSCKGNCDNSRCKCFKNNLVCNSACHSCKNCDK